ncbi:MAG: SAM-dependent chlorinase/fluorinase [Candidatus Omnitrophica bacterium]|nr:SAM-dependent chlorinase/fluorinase [Candidatus Omnitrophota bacterium]
MNGPIALLTDFGLKDHYAGTLKAVIATINPKAVVIDLSHEIGPQNIRQAAFLLKIAYSAFPRGSIFVCVVDPGVGTSRTILCVRTAHYYFLAPDNGLLSPVLSVEKPIEIRQVQNRKYFFKQPSSSTFHGRDIFSAVAAHLARQKSVFLKLGGPVRRIRSLDIPEVKKSKSAVQGEILYFDYFGNAMTNIEKQSASQDFWQKAVLSVKGKKLGTLQKTYGSSPKRLVGIFSSSNYLEIAFPNGSARQKGKLTIGDQVIAKV